MALKHLKRRFLALVVLLSFTILLVSCSQANIPNCIPDYAAMDCPVVTCPFDECFEGDYVKEKYISGKLHLIGISNAACGELFEEQIASSVYSCKLLQAEQIYKVGNTPEGEKWEWSLDCVCSYEI